MNSSVTPSPSTADDAKAAANAPLPPLTDPADLLKLLGRMCGSAVAMCLTVVWIVRTSLERDPKSLPKDIVLTATTAILSLALQIATVRLWRRLRTERLENEAQREALLAARRAGVRA